MEEYRTVYDIANDAMKFDWLFSIPFFAIGVGMIIYQVKINKKLIAYNSIFGFVFASFALFFGIIVGKSQISNYYEVQKMIEENSYQSVIGAVENFDPMPKSGHKHERFDVNGIGFEYSDYDIILGFNNTCSHGGPICNNGQEVKINYITKGNRNYIIQLNVKN